MLAIVPKLGQVSRKIVADGAPLEQVYNCVNEYKRYLEGVGCALIVGGMEHGEIMAGIRSDQKMGFSLLGGRSVGLSGGLFP
jgi:hypothetical protein